MAIVMNRSAGRRAAGEDLARGDAVAALHLLGPARAGQPVRAAAGDEDQLLGGDAAQQRLDRRPLVAPAPGRDRAPGACASTAPAPSSCSRARACAAPSAHLGVRGAAAAQLGGHAGREQPARAELGVVVGDERVVGVVGRRRGRRSPAPARGRRRPSRSAPVRGRSGRGDRHVDTSCHCGASALRRQRSRVAGALPRPKNGLAALAGRCLQSGRMKGYGQFCPVAVAARDLRRALDAADPARAAGGLAPLQRHPPGGAADLAHAAGPAAARAGRRRRRAEPAAAQRPGTRVPADAGRPRSSAR